MSEEVEPLLSDLYVALLCGLGLVFVLAMLGALSNTMRQATDAGAASQVPAPSRALKKEK